MSDKLTESIIGAAIEVHKILGPGLLESIYEDALCHELSLQGIQFKRQVPADISYKGLKLKGFKLDLVVENEVVVELKAVQLPPKLALAQTISYLKATGMKRGLIINFGETRLVDGITRVSL
jgi:GxxExxY protein